MILNAYATDILDKQIFFRSATLKKNHGNYYKLPL